MRCTFPGTTDLMSASRGFTLLETTLAVAVVAVLASGLALADLHNGGGAQTSAAQFDAAVAAARTLAANGTNGSTLVITPSQNGIVLRVYSGRPTSPSALTYSSVPDALLTASTSEANMRPPMTIFFDSHARASEMHGSVAVGSTIATDPGCPGSVTSLVFTIADSRASLTRTIPCF